MERCVLLLSCQATEKLPVAMRSGDTPVPIPNTMVKTRAADGTALEDGVGEQVAAGIPLKIKRIRFIIQIDLMVQHRFYRDERTERKLSVF